MIEAAVPPPTRDVVRLLADSGATRGCVLGGGTAISLHLGHRISRDLDLLVPRPGSDTIQAQAMIRRVRSASRPSDVSISLRTPSQLDVTIRGVRVSWVGYPFEFADPFGLWRGVDVLSLLDAGATKAYTIGRRPAARDYVDMYHVLRSGVTVDDLVDRATRTFVLDGSPVFDGHLFARQLTFTDDLLDVDSTMSEVQSGATWSEVVEGLRDAGVRWMRTRVDGRWS